MVSQNGKFIDSITEDEEMQVSIHFPRGKISRKKIVDQLVRHTILEKGKLVIFLHAKNCQQNRASPLNNSPNKFD